ncbi:MAG: class I SAM-dependent methyltransferase [Verrucomicrobiota bacterium]
MNRDFDKPTTKLNLYGDTLVRTQAGFGSDIASQRLDDLDQKTLDHIRLLSKSHPNPRVLEIGCGLGGLTIAMAQAGAKVIAVDRENYTEVISDKARRSQVGEQIKFQQASFEKLPKFSEAPFAIMVSQRMIHYLPFERTVKAIRKARPQLNADALLFISAAGLDSELGQNYPHKNVDVQNRFTPLAEDMSKKHHICGDVCLYREEDMRQLLIQSGFEPVKIFRSAFGNIKAIAQNKS